jgi:hypothetical protein
MKKSERTRRQLLIAGLGSLGAAFTLDAQSQDPAKVMPRAYRIVFENDRVRVLEFNSRPGLGICGESLHSHPAHLTVVLNEFTARATSADGTVRDQKRKAGEVFWSEAETHRVENVGRSGSRVLHVELKPLAPRKT